MRPMLAISLCLEPTAPGSRPPCAHRAAALYYAAGIRHDAHGGKRGRPNVQEPQTPP
jgi:hypothetical protein